CVTACPSGVQYSPLIEATRDQIERHYSRPFADRLFRRALFSIFPYPRRMRIALAPLALWSALRRASRREAERAIDQRLMTDDGRLTDQRLTTADQRLTTADQRLTSRVRAMLTLAPRVTWKSLTARVAERTPALGARRLSVGL